MITLKKAKQYNNCAFIQQDLIDWGINFIKPSEGDAIEFGAGTGLFTKELLSLLSNNLIATDISNYMLEEGKKNITHIQWEQMDAWDPKHFKIDQIYSSSLLQWTTSPSSTVNNWKNCLKDNGSIHALFFIKDTLKELYSIEPGISSINWLTLSDWEKTFQQAGLTIIDAKSLSKKYLFKDAISLFKILNIVGTTHCVSLTRQRLKEVILKYQKTFRQQNQVFATWHFCYIHAQKI